MDLTLTEEQELIASTARRFLESRCPISHVREMTEDRLGYSPEVWKEMAGLGWTAMAIPEEYGGLGAGFLELGLVVEEMGRHLLPGPFLETVAMVATALAQHGSDDQRRRLKKIAAGELIMTYVRAAPSAGWPEGGSTVQAVRSGDEFRLSGTADLAPFAEAADELLVAAQIGGDASHLTVFLVPSEPTRMESLDTVGPRRHQRVILDGVNLGSDAVLGKEGEGRAVMDTIEAFGTAALCAEMVGGAQRVLDMTVRYATEREQFGTPIGAFQAIQHHCADMGLDVLSSRLMAFEAIWRLSEGLDATEEISMAKAWVSEAYRRVCSLGHQVHGAIGFTEEHDLHLYLGHAIASELTFGDGDHHWGRIADQLGVPSWRLQPGGVHAS